MQEIAMLGAVTPVATSTSNKSAAKGSEKDFDRVFADKQQVEPKKSAEAKSESRASRSAQRQETEKVQEPVATDEEVAEVKDSAGDETLAAEDVGAGDSDTDTVKDAAATVQQTLIELMQILSGVDSESVDSEEVTKLVTDLVQQLETTDLHGEEVLAGIDLSALKEQINQITAGDNVTEDMAALVSQISEQLQSLVASLPETSAVVDVATSALQHTKGPMAEARDLLQQVFGSDSGDGDLEQKAASGAEAEGVAVGELSGDDGEVIDPRFAGLLNIRQGQKDRQATTNKNQFQNSQLQNQSPSQAQGAAMTAPAEITGDNSEGIDQQLIAELTKVTQALTGESVDQAQQTRAGVDGIAQHGAHLQPAQNSMFADGLKNMTAPATIQLPSGQQVAESQIFDQVMTHISGSVNGESGRMVLRLNPAELGSLKLDVVVDGDEVRANIHAQSQQVQEVIERHLPQLRNALAEQGLKIEQFQVDIDKQQSDGSFQSFADQQQQQNHGSWNYEDVAEEDLVPVAQLFQPSGGGISLHV